MNVVDPALVGSQTEKRHDVTDVKPMVGDLWGSEKSTSKFAAFSIWP